MGAYGILKIENWRLKLNWGADFMIFGHFFRVKAPNFGKRAPFFVFLDGYGIRFSLFELIFIEERKRARERGSWCATVDGGPRTVVRFSNYFFPGKRMEKAIR
jgi:hypothetical protein